jgi:uncharacterized protein
MDTRILFHIAIPIADIPRAKEFYVGGLGCSVGRETASAIILNLYGHQVVGHVAKEPLIPQAGIYPRHFGIVFTLATDWEELLQRVQNRQLPFRQPPRHRFVGELTEHATFFLEDPFYNLLEFKHYRHEEAIFGAREVAAIGDRQ